MRLATMTRKMPEFKPSKDLFVTGIIVIKYISKNGGILSYVDSYSRFDKVSLRRSVMYLAF